MQPAHTATIAAALGAATGALLPRVAYRWSTPAGTPTRRGCHRCDAAFPPGPNGWITTRHHCQNCGNRLGPPWTALAAILAVASAALTWRQQPTTTAETLLLVAWLLTAAAGLLLACVDITVRRLPTPIVYATAAALATIIATTAATSHQPGLLITALTAGGVLGIGHLLLAVGTGTMGMGDVRLAALLGMALGTVGWPAVLAGAVLPYLLATPHAVALTVTAGRREHLPFGPYLVSGAILAVLTTG